MARYRLNMTKYVLKWPTKNIKISKILQNNLIHIALPLCDMCDMYDMRDVCDLKTVWVKSDMCDKCDMNDLVISCLFDSGYGFSVICVMCIICVI